MKALTTILFPDAPEQVTVGFTLAEAQQLTSDLERVIAVAASDENMTEVMTRLLSLDNLLQHQVGRLKATSQKPCEADTSTARMPRQDHSEDAPATFKGIPLQHVEWAVRVYRVTDGRRAESETLARVFEKGEAPAKAFFNQTQNIWNIKVNSGEAQGFHVVLGVQDARKHKKKGSFREVDCALCTGGVK